MPRDKALCMSQYAGKEGKGLMKQTVLKTTVAVLGAGLVSYLGTLAVPMLVLLSIYFQKKLVFFHRHDQSVYPRRVKFQVRY